MPKSSGWSIGTTEFDLPTLDVNPADAAQMTENVTALHPVQPTPLTQSIESVMPSRFASRFTIVPPAGEDAKDYDLSEGHDALEYSISGTGSSHRR